MDRRLPASPSSLVSKGNFLLLASTERKLGKKHALGACQDGSPPFPVLQRRCQVIDTRGVYFMNSS